MHRTEGTDNVGNLFTDGPPGTVVEQNWCNAVQEELCYLIETLGGVLKTAATDTRDQLYTALVSAAFPLAMGLTATVAEINTACDGITATAAEINTACDGITATASEINTACDGSTAKNSHTHALTSGATDVTATAAEINTACDGSTAKNSHTHVLTSGATDVTATAAAVNDMITNGKYASRGLLLGNTTATQHVVKAMLVDVFGQDGSTKIQVQGINLFNGDAIGLESDLTKGGSTTSFTLSADGGNLHIKNAAISGTPIGVFMTSVGICQNTNTLFVWGTISGSDLEIIYYPLNSVSHFDLTTLPIGNQVTVMIMYITQ